MYFISRIVYFNSDADKDTSNLEYDLMCVNPLLSDKAATYLFTFFRAKPDKLTELATLQEGQSTSLNFTNFLDSRKDKNST